MYVKPRVGTLGFDVPLMNTFEVQESNRVVEALKLLVLISFATITSFPSPALAYTNNIGGFGTGMDFVVDGKLVSQTTSGITNYDPTLSASELLNTDYARIPDYTPIFYPDQIVRVIATAYSSTPGQTDSSPFTTASGTYVHTGTLAANFLPFGTEVEIAGKVYIVEDRLNARYNSTYIVDIWMASQDQALAHGIRVVEMKIIALP